MSLKDIPPQIDVGSEEDVRFAVSQYFTELEFGASEMSFEDYFSIQLGHSTVKVMPGHLAEQKEVKQVGGRSDLLLTMGDHPIAVVEIKRDGHRLTDDDAWQAISYARLLREIAPFAIVTNGRDTKVYDTLKGAKDLAELMLDNPAESIWDKNSRTVVGVNEDLRSFAAHRLITINSDSLAQFCTQQVARTTFELVGTINENRVIIPEVYLERNELKERFKLWLSGDDQCFALVGPSGTGKTNSLYAAATGLQGDCFVLFYRAIHIRGSLFEAIRSDFVWEFRQDKSLAYLVDRISDLAKRHSKEVIVFVDALDEFRGDALNLRSELLELTKLTKDLPLRICVSCKTVDWLTYITERETSYNYLAHVTFPQSDAVKSPPPNHRPAPEDVGFHLNQFSSKELDLAYGKYSLAYQLPRGQLSAVLRSQIQDPQVLRLFAEVYRESDSQLPTDISKKDVWERYLERKLSQSKNRGACRRILGILTEKLVMEGTRTVLLDELFREVEGHQGYELAIGDLLRSGLTLVQTTDSGSKQVLLPFETLRSFLFVKLSRQWLDLPADRVAADIANLTISPQQLKLEAIQFFLTAIDRGETEVLTILVTKYLQAFLALTSPKPSTTSPSASLKHLSTEDRSDSYGARLNQYAQSYSSIRLEHFPNLASRLAPYASGDTGVLVASSGAVQLRQTNELHPELVLPISDEYIERIMSGTVSQRWHTEFGRPAGPIYLDGMRELLQQFPQRLAWDEIVVGIGELLRYQLLNETASPLILEERIDDVMFDHPRSWSGQAPDHRRCFQWLGFSRKEVVYATPLTELHGVAHRQLLEITGKLQSLDDSQSDLKRFWTEQWRYMYLLQYWFAALSKFQEYLTTPKWDIESLFESINNPAHGIEVLKSLMPDTLASYQTMVEKNFPSIAGDLKLFSGIRSGSPILVELTRNPFSGLYSSYSEVRFVVLPKGDASLNGTVLWANGADSLAHTSVQWTTPRGSVITSLGGGFGQANLNLSIEGCKLENEPAFIYRIKRFPTKQPVSTQVYELLGVELEVVLDGERFWRDVESADYQRLAKLQAHQDLEV